MANNDYVKYMTQRIVKYMDTPKDERKKLKEARKQQEIAYSNKWFGVLPFAFRLLIQKRKD
ncbi:MULTISPECIES: YqzE family protein [Gracilibacillus]|uniref:YqzE family protein n=1 Tax=Gracilibacillus thailandensis TaxID=563735 RepID=A0A6N7R118_9BACI|nr:MULTISPECIES: YqzE family protein [Gracilibacillus]MRI67292.1 YqzE family protein [Gracilibacillus thailandensis]